MKIIKIKGKKKIDRFNNSTKRTQVSTWKYPDLCLKRENQIVFLNQLYLNQNFDGIDDVKREIKKKINSYGQQDKRRDIFDSKKLIESSKVP